MFRTLSAAAVLGLLSSPVLAKDLLVNCMWPAQHFFCGEVLKPWADDVARVTEGRVTVSIPASTLAPPPKQIDSVRGGLFDAGVTFNGFMAKELTGQMVSMLPFTASNDARAASMALWATYEHHLSKTDEYDGLHLLSAFVGPGGDFYSLNHTPITAFKHATDRKMWALPGVTSAVLKGGGGNVVSGPAIRMGEIIQSGVVDGFVGIPPLDAGKFNALQYAKSMTVTDDKIMNPSFSFVISDAAWAEISSADQEAIMSVSGSDFAEKVGTIWTRLNDASLAKVGDGLEVSEASEGFEAELLAASQPAIDKWLKVMADSGHDGQAILDFYLAEVATQTSR